MWYVGQKVVCVKTARNNNGQGVNVGQIYTVSNVGECGCSVILSVGLINLYGNTTKCAKCGVRMHGDDLWVYADRFRPLDALTETIERIESEGAPEVHELQTV